MSTFRHDPDGTGGSNAWSGAATTIDEGFENANDSDFINAVNEDDLAQYTIENALFATGDYVKSISLRMRARTVGSGTDRITARIGTTALDEMVNVDLNAAAYDDWCGFDSTLRNLGTNYNTTFNALNFECDALQQGMAATVGHRISVLDFYVEAFKATPSKGEVAWYADGGDTGVSTLTLTFAGSHTAKSGNILIATFATGGNAWLSGFTPPSGYTLLQTDSDPSGSAMTWYTYWKVSDGTETGVTFSSSSGNFSNAGATLIEIEWSGGTPTLQSNKNVTDEDATVTTHTTTGITPTNASDNAVIALLFTENMSEWAQPHINEYANYSKYKTLLLSSGSPTTPGTARGNSVAAVGQNRSGSQTITFYDDQSNGGSVASAMIVINASSTPQTIGFNQVTETDTANAFTAIIDQTVAFNQVTETDTAQIITPVPGTTNIAYNQVLETDVAQIITPVPGTTTIAYNQVLEIDTAQIITPVPGVTTIAYNQVTEIDTAQTITPIESVFIAYNQVVETDTAQIITPVPGATTIAFNQVIETDTAQIITPVPGAVTIGFNQVVETDVAQIITPVPGTATISFNQVTETDVAQIITPVPGETIISFNQVVETDTAQIITPVPGVTTIAFNQVVETDTAQIFAVIQGQFVSFNQVVETDTPQVITPIPGATTVLFNQVTEIDTVNVITPVTGATPIPQGRSIRPGLFRGLFGRVN